MWMQKYKKISRFLTFKRFLYQTEEYFYYFFEKTTLPQLLYQTFCQSFSHKTEASINIITIFAEQFNRSYTE